MDSAPEAQLTSSAGIDVLIPKHVSRSNVWSQALRGTLWKLNPIGLIQNPVVLLAELAAALVSLVLVHDLLARTTRSLFDLQLAIWLWLTVLLANFGQALAEARGKAQADALRRSRSELLANRMNGRKIEVVPATKLRAGDVILVQSGDLIPVDGEIVEGIAMVDESVITGESAPVIRESGGSLSAVTSGTRVLSDHIKVRVTAAPAETFIDRMIGVVEFGTEQRTRSEIALQSVIASVTVASLVAVTALFVFARLDVREEAMHAPGITSFLALLVCLVPTAIGSLLPAVSIAGVNRLVHHNVLVTSRRIVERAREVTCVMLDKTGTLTIGDRRAVEFLPIAGVPASRLARAAGLASIGDETLEGQSTASLAEAQASVSTSEIDPADIRVIPFSAFTRMSGVDVGGKSFRKGAALTIAAYVREGGGEVPEGFTEAADEIARTGGTPLGVAEGRNLLGLIHLKDTVKADIRTRLSDLRPMGIESLLITGDNVVTAEAIGREVGVDRVLAQATPADKLSHIKQAQAGGATVAMSGDGTNDAPALAQADLGLVMNSGAAAAKEAGNLLDLDSDPAKIVTVLAIGRQIWVTRLALLVFSVTASIVQCLLVLPAMLQLAFPALRPFNLLQIHTPHTAVLSAVLCNAALMLLLLPVALQGVVYHAAHLRAFLWRNIVFYFVAGLLAPFPLIWAADRILTFWQVR